MTLLQERKTQTPMRVPEASRRRSPWPIVAAVVGVVGLVAALVGLWMYYAPASGILTLFGWEWTIAEISTAWPFALIVAGSLGVSGTSAYAAITLFDADSNDVFPVMSTILAIASFAVAMYYAIVWIF